MTCRELIIYILENNLEDEPVFKNGKFIGTMTISEAAAKLNVGSATIRSLIDSKQVECYSPYLYLVPVNCKKK